jgi:hypothetical protein
MDYVRESALLLLLAQRRLRPEALKPLSSAGDTGEAAGLDESEVEINPD